MYWFLPAFTVLALLSPPVHAADMGPDAYQFYLNDHAGLILRYGDPESCPAKVAGRKKFSDGPEENRALDRILEICAMPAEELQNLARSYECGCAGVPEDKKLAAYIYYFLYFQHKQRDALYRLKALGENVVTEADPLTKEEMDEIIRSSEQMMKEIEGSVEDSESFLKKHSLPFPFFHE